MRRRSPLAALPVHRHAVPQVAVDAGLVALAYFLAYRLRFDGGVPPDYQDLFERTLSLVVIGYVAIVQPKLVNVGYPRGLVPVSIPVGVLALYGLLMLVFLAGVRYA